MATKFSFKNTPSSTFKFRDTQENKDKGQTKSVPNLTINKIKNINLTAQDLLGVSSPKDEKKPLPIMASDAAKNNQKPEKKSSFSYSSGGRDENTSESKYKEGKRFKFTDENSYLDFMDYLRDNAESTESEEAAQIYRRAYQRVKNIWHQKYTPEGQAFKKYKRDNLESLRELAMEGNKDAEKEYQDLMMTDKYYYGYRGLDDVDYAALSYDYNKTLNDAREAAEAKEDEYNDALVKSTDVNEGRLIINDMVKHYIDTGEKQWTGSKLISDDTMYNLIDLYKTKEKAGMYYQSIIGQQVQLDALRMASKYDIDPETFDNDDLDDWALNNGLTFVDGEARKNPIYSAEKLGKSSEEMEEKADKAIKDAKILKTIATQNTSRKRVEKGGWSAAWENAKGLVTTPLRALNDISYAIGSAVSGDVDIYSPLIQDEIYYQTVKDVTQKEYTSKWFDGYELPVVGNAGNLIYNTGMSVGENVVNMLTARWLGTSFGLEGKALNTVTAELTSGLMSSSATANRMREAKLNGASDKEAVLLGIADGTVEYLTEKYSLEQILNGKWIYSGLTEGSEELASNWLNRGIDQALRPATNDLKMSYYKYRNEGLSEKEALEKVFYDILSEDTQAGLSGMLSGYTMGGVSNAGNAINMSKMGGDIVNRGAAIGTINEGLDFGTNTEAYKSAENLTKRLVNGKKISNLAIGKQASLNASALVEYGKTFGDSGQNVFNRFYVEGQSPTEYAREMSVVYNAGTEGKAMPKTENILSEQANAMYEAGKIDRGNAVGVIKSDVSEAFKAENPKVYNILNGISEKYGTKIVIDDYLDGADGYFDPETAELHINANAQNPVAALIKHEITHMAEGTEEYNELMSYLKSDFAEEWAQKESDIKGLYERVNKSRAKKGLDAIRLSSERLSSEVVAEFAEQFESEQFLERVANQNPSMLVKIRDFIRDIIRRLKNVFSSDEAKRWQKAQRMWEDAVNKAEVTSRTGDVEYKTKYDYSKSFAEQIDDYKKGNIPKNDTLIVGATPKVWQDVGFNAIPFTINQTHIDYALNNTLDDDHYIGETNIKNLPEAIKKPVAIIQSKTHPDRAIGILTMWNNGKKVIIPVEVDGYGMTNGITIDSNAITSILGKGNILNQLKDAINNTVNGQKELFYWNKKEALSLLQTAGHRLPGNLPQDGFVHSIREDGSKVKTKFKNVTETQQFRRWFGKSKVVNEDGTPKVVYHGTFSKFTVFDKGNKTSKAPESAFFFTDDEDVAYSYTGYKDVVDFENTPDYQGGIYPVYLSMKNPYIVDFKGNVWNDKSSVGMDINEVVRYAMDNGYDGVIAKNIIDAGDMGDKSWNEKTPIKSATDYIVFSSNQIKSATDNIGTFDSENPDIRYKLQEPMDIEEENRQLKAELEDVQKRLVETQARAERAEARMRPQVLEKDIQGLAGKLIKEYGSDLKKSDITDQLRDLGNYILRMGDGKDVYSFDAVKSRAEEIANAIIEYAKQETPFADTYKAIRKYFKDTKITVTQKGDFADFKEFRDSVFGKMRIVNEGGAAIDTIWGELSEMFGEGLFPSDITAESDMLQYVADFLNDMDKVYYNPYNEMRGEMREIIANGIIQELTDNVRTVALGDALDLNEKLIAEKKRNSELMRLKSEIKNTEAALAAEWDKLHKKEAENLKEKNKLAEKKQKAKEREARQRLLKVLKEVTSRKFYDRASEATRADIDRLAGEINTAAVSILGTTIEKRNAWLGKYIQLALDNDFIPNKAIEEQLKKMGVKVTQTEDGTQITSLKSISEMDIDDVLALTDALISIEHEVQTANRLIGTEENLEIRNVGLDIISDIMATTGRKGLKKDNLLTAIYGAESLLKGESMVNRIIGYNSDSKLKFLWDEVINGMTKKTEHEMLSNRRFRKWTENKKFMESISGKKSRTITITGTEGSVKVTPAMVMSLYMHAQNYQNLRHIQKGGLHIPNYELLMKGDTKNAMERFTTLHMTPTEVNAATAALTAEERAFCDEMRAYYEWAAEKINVISNLLTGRDIAVVKKYFPINTDSRFLSSDSFIITADGNLENMGFLQERINSITPIWLFGADEVLTKSIDQHAKYVGLAVPLRNFNKVFGVLDIKAQKVEDMTKIPKEQLDQFDLLAAKGKSQIDFENNIQTAITEKWGGDTWEYMLRLLQDISGVQRSASKLDTILGKLKSKSAAVSLMLNAGVAIKQTASYPTAAAELGYKALRKGLTMKLNKSLLEKSALYWLRQQGWTNTELAEYKQSGGKLPKGLNWIQAMDLATCRRLLCATEAYIRKNNPGLTGAEYEKAVLDKYHEVIRRTQPNYTPTERPEIMRDKNIIAQVASLYKTQPFQNFNILYDAIGNYKAQKNRLANLQEQKADTTQAQKDKTAAGKRLVIAVTSQALSSFVFALIQFGYDALRGKTKRYKNDDDEYTFLSILKALGINMAGNGFGMFPFGSVLWSGAEQFTDTIIKTAGGKAFFGEKNYVIQNPMFDMFNDLGTDALKVTTEIEKAIIAATNGEDVDWESLLRKSYKAASAVFAFKGVPLNNIKNDIDILLKNTIRLTKGQDEYEYWNLRITSKPENNKKEYYDLLYKMRGKKAYDTIKELLIENDGFTEKDIEDAMNDRYLEKETNYKNDLKNLISASQNTEYYKDLSDEDKKKFEDKCKKYAKGVALKSKKEPDKWVTVAEKLNKSSDIPIEKFIEIYTEGQKFEGDDRSYKLKDYIDSKVTSVVARKALYDLLRVSKSAQEGKGSTKSVGTKSNSSNTGFSFDSGNKSKSSGFSFK